MYLGNQTEPVHCSLVASTFLFVTFRVSCYRALSIHLIICTCTALSQNSRVLLHLEHFVPEAILDFAQQHADWRTSINAVRNSTPTYRTRPAHSTESREPIQHLQTLSKILQERDCKTLAVAVRCRLASHVPQ
jgi:hypothetical protein